MRCSLCLGTNRPAAARCAGCGAVLDETRHREYWGVVFLLGQLSRWEDEKRCPPELVESLRTDYAARRARLREALIPAPIAEAPAPPPVSALEKVVRPVPHEPPPAPEIPTAPPRPPFSWKNLLTENNIRWILNLGIFIFSVALAVFIHTQWGGMPAGVKISILFGASFAAMGAGHFLRRTMLKATGMALVGLGAIALPIDCAALVTFRLVPQAMADEVGLAGSLLSLAVYAALARLYSEKLFANLGALAAVSAWAFLLRNLFQAPWELVVPWMAPFALALYAAARGSVAVRRASLLVLGGAVGTAVALLAAGELDVGRHAVPLEAALASGVAAAWLASRRRPHAAWAWLQMLLLWGMFAVATGHFRLGFRENWPWLALLGAAFGLGWIRRSPAFVTGGVVAAALSVLAALPDFRSAAAALAIPAALHAALGFRRGDARHAFAGWLLAGLALAAALNGFEVPRLWQPLALAAYGVAMAVLARAGTKDAFQVLAATGAGAAMLLLALWYPEYYRFKPAPAGQASQILGAAVALVSAFAFGPLANQIRSRFVSDITYGCAGFAYLLTLRFAGVPGMWLGLSLALFGVAYVLLEKPISRWLLRPTLFTGIACTVAGAVFAFLQWFVWKEHLPASLTLLLIGAFYLAVAQATPHKWVAHIGTYVAAAGLLVGLEHFRLPVEARPLAVFLPAAVGMALAGRRRDLHLGIATLVVGLGALAFAYLDPAMYGKAQAPMTIALSLAAAGLAGWFAFSQPRTPGVDVRLASGLMGAFASTAYIVWLRSISTGSPWGGLVIFAMAAALAVAAELLRRSGLGSQGWPLVCVALVVAGVSLFAAHDRGMAEGVHLWVYGLSLAIFTIAGRQFGRIGFSWAGAAAGAAGLVFWLLWWRESTPWIGVLTFPLVALALQKREKPLAALGVLAGLICPAWAAWSLQRVETAGLVFVAMAAFFLFTRVWPLAFPAMALGAAISFGHEPWNSVVAFLGFALFLGMALGRRQPALLYASLALALVGDFHVAMSFEGHGGLVALPLAFVLLGMAWEVSRRFGREYGWPLLGAAFAAALQATVFGFAHPTDRIVVFLADAVLFACAASLFRRPELMYPCSASLVALAMALMARFQLPRIQMAFYLVTLALAKVIFVRVMGERLKPYFQPVFAAAVVLAAGAVAFGILDHERSLGPGGIDWSIWGLIIVAAVFGIGGRIRKQPAFVYLAGSTLLGAYYLSLHKYSVRTLEFFTVPIAVALVAWSLLVLREVGWRRLVEALAVGVLILPSAVQSYLPGRDAHGAAALVLAILAVIAGMAMRRRVLVLGGTGLFVGEVLGKAVRFLVERDLSLAAWGMILGGLIILVAAAFESRKAAFVREKVELLSAVVGRQATSWE